MRNLFLLSSDKPSRLYKSEFTCELEITSKPLITISEDSPNQNIYITSDEEIKDGDWFYDLDTKYVKVKQSCENSHLDFNGKKIILTTDQELIKDGVQAISDDFLEWFVKNPGCEYVELKDSKTVKEHIWDGSNDGEIIWEKEIIIPKEESNIIIEECLFPDFNLDKGIFDKITSLDKPKESKGEEYEKEKLQYLEEKSNYKKALISAMYEAHRNRKELKKEEIEFFEIEEAKPHTFCETPDEKCTMNYCDENGCQNRKRELVEPENMIETKQETLEEAAISYAVDVNTKMGGNKEAYQNCSRLDFIAGAKWQAERMYSEEEVLKMLLESEEYTSRFNGRTNLKPWFEQNKK